MISTLAVDGWAVTFGTVKKGLGPAQSPHRCTKCNNTPVNGQCTNFILFIFGTRQRLAGIQTSAGVSVAGTVVHFAEAVKLLGVTLDCALTFNQYVANVVRACTYHTRALRLIRPLLTVDTAKSIATSIVGARSIVWHL